MSGVVMSQHDDIDGVYAPVVNPYVWVLNALYIVLLVSVIQQVRAKTAVAASMLAQACY
jgi:DNA-binding protein Fis